MFRFPVDDDIELRLHEEWHADELFELVDDNRDHLRPWFPWVETTRDAADSLEFIRGARQSWADNEGIPTSVWFRGDIAGTCGLMGLDWNVGRAELGYWLGERFEGKGIITRSCRALLDYAFEELELNRIVIRCLPDNDRSAAVADRLGATYEGTAREAAKVRDELQDVEVYSVLARDW